MWRRSRHPHRRTATRVTSKKTTTRARLSRSKIAQRRLKIRSLQVAVGVVLIVSFIGAVSWLSFLDAFAVKTIIVEGNEKVRTRAIESQMMLATADAGLGLFSRQNTILYPSSELENILAFEFPKIETVSIKAKPTQQQVVVSITERSPYAQWCRQNECYNLGIDGYIYESVGATSTDLITFRGGIDESRVEVLRTSLVPKYFEQVLNFIDALTNLDLEVAQFVFEQKDARILFEDGWELRVALDKDLGITSFNLAAILDEYKLRDRLRDVLYIDMRFDERVYYKLRESTDNEE